MSTVHTFTTKNYNVILSRSQLSVCVISRNLTEITSQLLNKTNHLLAFAHIHTHTQHIKSEEKELKNHLASVLWMFLSNQYISSTCMCVYYWLTMLRISYICVKNKERKRISVIIILYQGAGLACCGSCMHLSRVQILPLLFYSPIFLSAAQL